MKYTVHNDKCKHACSRTCTCPPVSFKYEVCNFFRAVPLLIVPSVTRSSLSRSAEEQATLSALLVPTVFSLITSHSRYERIPVVRRKILRQNTMYIVSLYIPGFLLEPV